MGSATDCISRHTTFMSDLGRETRSAILTLLRSPAASAVAVLTLALGIGANTAIFSLLNAVVLRTLPVPHPEQLVAVRTTIADNTNGAEPLSLPMFEEMSRRQSVFSAMFACSSGAISNFEANGRHFTAALAAVSGDYYRAMGIAPLVGRFIERGDVALEAGTSNAVAVVSYRVWRGWYQGDANIIGRTIRIGIHPFTIIGVEPEGYSGLTIDGSTDVTVPLFGPQETGPQDLRGRHLLWLTVYGRIRPGLTFAQARSGLVTVWPQILEATMPPEYAGEHRTRYFARRLSVESAATGESFLRKRFAYSLDVLLGLVGAVLLIACLNLANVSLARAAARQHETGVRVALGAGRWDLMRQPLIESLLLSVAGALLGLGLAYWASAALLRIVWTGLVKTTLSASPDWRVLVFTSCVTVGTALLFALVPAWHMARTRPIEALGQQTRSVRGGSSLPGKALLVTQLALSLVLVMGALLFGQTLKQLHSVDVGYRRDHFLTVLLFPQPGHSRMQNSAGYYLELAAKLKRIPGVEAVSFSGNGPANEFEFWNPVRASLAQAPALTMEDFVGPDFFAVAGMHVLSGREFNWQDGTAGREVAIISQRLAERLFGQEDAIGRTFYTGPIALAQKLRIVGVVNSASLWKVETAHPMAIYQPMAKTFTDGDPLVDIRTTVDPRSVKTAAERVVASLGHQYSLRTMTVEERLDSYITVQRVTAMLAAFFGAVALLIAAIGVYGLMSFHVARRTADLGIRMALGAQREQVLWMVLREVLWLGAIGCALGLGGSLFFGRYIGSILFGVSVADPTMLAAAMLTLLVVAMFAGFLPARRAASVDPMRALRVE